MNKILIIFGTRPEAIKMCPLVKELQKNRDINVVVCVTGQHREMLDGVMNTFGISADYNLSIMKPKQTLFEITTMCMDGIRKIIESENPTAIVVHGDTTTAFSAALSGYYMRIPVYHVEAGLRTYDHYAPYPEEFNRVAIDNISDICFAPTEEAKNNLIREGIISERIFITGNTGIDALCTTINKDFQNELLDWVSGSKYILMTLHRREIQGDVMNKMFIAIRHVAEKYPELKFIYPIHKNPIVRELAKSILHDLDNIRIIEPLDTVDFHNMMSKSYIILTDSGGIQEEAAYLGKPTLVLREITERPEGVEKGVLQIVGTNPQNIERAIIELIDNEEKYNRMARSTDVFGDGKASSRIASIICRKMLKNG